MQMQWGVSADGGYLANPKISKSIRQAAQPLSKFRQFVRTEPGFGLKHGDRQLIDRVANVTTAGGKLVETEKIPETKAAISQGSVIVYEWGNSVPLKLAA